MNPIAELDALDDVKSLQRDNQPAVIRGMVSDWTLVKKAASGLPALADYLRSFDVGHPFQAMIAPSSQGGRLFYKPDLSGFNFDRLNGDLAEALKILEALSDKPNPPTFYVGSKKIEEYLPGLEVETPMRVLPSSVAPSIWFGNASVVATHNDDSENLACVAAGSRKFVLFPPDEEENLYLGPPDLTPAGRVVSLVDLQAPNLKAFPRFERALRNAQCATLRPGDVIYIPTNWWHNVEALGSVNVLVNFWWRD
ncbi:cupin-like domain-containing protein [Gilvimarinus algae]|uniref:Cupin-like domain-containing protein n=1 Tax=Gilvimarinus algae TaxID=3058037 RepID=A0ABT8TDT4_9GAMM|nr:cupin-like domain-containing protein [Gilvimarinus sp. SDUM040014]MDO3381283.1 cupin-like domain-containing protein [Gilvimarinus sp. SDUM040014]